MRILVTGGAGFIGSHLVRALVAEGHKVTIVDCMDPQVHGKQEWKQFDVHGVKDYPATIIQEEDHGAWRGLEWRIESCRYDAVFHLAAKVGVGQAQYQISDYVDNNVSSTAWMLNFWAANPDKRPGRLIVASSMSIYGEAPTDCSPFVGDKFPWELPQFPRAVRETDPITVPNVYAQTKYDQERYCLLFGDAYGVPTVAARFFNVFGPGQSLSNPYTGVAAIFAACLLAGIDAPIFDDGLQTRDFIHVSDIVSGLMAMLHAPAEKVAGEAINLGTGSSMTLLGLYAMLGQAIGKPRAPLPTGIKRKGDIRHCHADISKARQLLDWSPRVTLAQGIEEYAEWLATQDVSGVLERVEQMRRELAEKGLVS